MLALEGMFGDGEFMVKITSRAELEDWLDDKPKDWALVIAARAALRVLPIALTDEFVIEYDDFTLALLSSTLISWAAGNITSYRIHFRNASIIDSAATTGNSSAHDAIFAIYCANETAYRNNRAAATSTTFFAARAVTPEVEFIWLSIEDDIKFLERSSAKYPAMNLTSAPLWSSQNVASEILHQWQKTRSNLLEINNNFIHWIDWYERRLLGKDSGFDIPHDIDRTEDKAILIKLADATDEEFWDKGPEYVNAQLGEWLREARQRAQERYEQENDGIGEDVLDEENIPPQETSVTSFAPRDDGKIDRAPATPDNRLRDVPDARQSYADLRKKVEKLRQEGQRLGGNLKEALDDFLSSLPEDFEQALAYNIWRDGTNLREIFELHEIAIQSPDYDPDKLENAIALRLKGVLSLFNNFAFDDDGLRQRDERIPPQKEVQNAAQEAQLSKSITEAAADDKDISTEIVRTDLNQIVETYQIDANTTYAQQKLIEINKIIRNFVAALMTVARGVLKEVKKSASNIRDGAEKELGKTLVKTSKYLVILEYIKHNAPELKQFVITAYTNPTLVKLIDDVVQLVSKSL